MIRYGVVNEEERTKYEKEWQLPYSYIYITTDSKAAIRYCNRISLKTGKDYIVEKIYHEDGINNVKEIFFKTF